MSHCKKILFSILCFSIAACGGGGGGDGEEKRPSAESIQERLDKDPATRTVAQLKSDYWDLAQSLYTGESDKAELTPENVQSAARQFLGESSYRIPPFYDYYVEIVDGKFSGEIDKSFDCYFGGTISFLGTLSANHTGNLSLQYENCDVYDGVYNGEGVVSIVESENEYDGALFFRSLELIAFGGAKQTIAGYHSFDTTSQPYAYETAMFIWDSASNLSVLLNMEESSRYDEYYYALSELSGNVKLSDTGSIDVSTVEPVNSNFYTSHGSVLFTGAGRNQFLMDAESHNILKLLKDSNADGEYETGLLFNSLDEFLFTDISGSALVPVASLSLPPSVEKPYLVSYNASRTALDSISVNSYASDRDTDFSELTLTYEWVLNGAVLAGQTSDTLPAMTAVYGDELVVYAVASDGTHTTKSTGLSIELEDSPAVVEVTGIPSEVIAGNKVTFTAQVTDPDLGVVSAQPAQLVYGPPGTVDKGDGIIEWTASELLFNNSSVHFGFASGGENTEDYAVKVVAPSVDMPIARSGIEVPRFNYSMQIADFLDADGVEIISTDSQSRVFALKRDTDGNFYQAWMYPYSFVLGDENESIVKTFALDLDDDSLNEIVVVTTRNIFTIADERSMATLLWSASDGDITNATIDDADFDGVLELAILTGTGSSKALSVYSLDDDNTLMQHIVLTSSAKEILFANVDNDSQLELISNDGFVFDGVSWANQWYYGAGFGGSYLAAGDLNGDGIAEIAGAGAWGDIQVFDAQEKSILSVLDDSNACSIVIANTDSISPSELVVGDCSWGEVNAYSLVDNALEEQWTVGVQGSGSKSIAVGNLDSDQEMEVIWGTGQSSSGADQLVVASIGVEASVDWSNSEPAQLDSFYAAGWTDVTPGEERAIFIVPETDSGYGGQRIVTMSADGRYSVSDEISRNWEGGRYGVATDYDNNGNGDIFLATAQTYDGAFKVFDLNTYTVAWETSGDYDNNVGVTVAADIDGDGYEDALYVDGKVVRIVNVMEQTLLGSITASSGYGITDLAVTTLDSDGPLIAMSYSSGIEIKQKNGALFNSIGTITTTNSCTRIEFANVDDDAALELICTSSGSSYYSTTSDIIVYDFSAGITEQFRFTVEGEITDFVFVPERNSILAGVTEEGGSYYSAAKASITEFSLDARGPIWSSAPLIGEISHRSIYYRANPQEGSARLMFATNYAMYLVQ